MGSFGQCLSLSTAPANSLPQATTPGSLSLSASNCHTVSLITGHRCMPSHPTLSVCSYLHPQSPRPRPPLCCKRKALPAGKSHTLHKTIYRCGQAKAQSKIPHLGLEQSHISITQLSLQQNQNFHYTLACPEPVGKPGVHSWECKMSEQLVGHAAML